MILEIVPDQNAELLRLQSGETDLSQDALRPDDYVPVKRLEQQGTLTMQEIGVATDADGLWFCLKPEVRKKDPRWAFVQRREFRQALSHAVDREEFAHTVFLGEAVPIWGPITPGNKAWFSPNLPRYPYDEAKAKELLKSIGLEDRDGNGVVEDAKGTEARFTVLTQKGLTWYERGTAVVRDAAAKVGVALDVAPIEAGSMVQRLRTCDYDAIYMRVLVTDTDPAGNMDYWVSSGEGHPWNIASKAPATEWEARVDALMQEQAGTIDMEQAPRHLRAGAEGHGREPAGDPLRRAAALRGALHARAGRGAVGDAPAPAVERRHAQRVEPAGGAVAAAGGTSWPSSLGLLDIRPSSTLCRTAPCPDRRTARAARSPWQRLESNWPSGPVGPSDQCTRPPTIRIHCHPALVIRRHAVAILRVVNERVRPHFIRDHRPEVVGGRACRHANLVQRVAAKQRACAVAESIQIVRNAGSFVGSPSFFGKGGPERERASSALLIERRCRSKENSKLLSDLRASHWRFGQNGSKARVITYRSSPPYPRGWHR